MSLLRSAALAAASLGGAAELAPARARPDDKPKVKIEFRRAETKAAEGLTEATVPGSKQKIYLHKAADLTNADVAEATVGEDAGKKPTLDIKFTKEGVKKAATLSAEHRNKPVAIVINGKVVSAPVIRAKIAERAQITGDFTKEELEKIAKAINEK
jgi:preprotein translocase subunit SecD